LADAWQFRWIAMLPILPLLLGIVWIYRKGLRHYHGVAPAALDAGLAFALAAFFPVLFVVPFFAGSLVPLSYLAISGFIGESLNGVSGAILVLIYTIILTGIMRIVRSCRTGTRQSNLKVVVLLVILSICSLLPIYCFQLPYEWENIIGLFTNEHSWGQ
jgi:hypothetical protein